MLYTLIEKKRTLSPSSSQKVSFLDTDKLVSVVDFNQLSTNPARLQPISYLTRLKFKVTTLKVLTRLNNLGCNPLSWKWIEFKKSKIQMYRSFVN
jgi:hypothetical protein